MGWKSTIDITREEAMALILEKIVKLNNVSNEELASVIENLGFGDDTELPYYGYNFNIIE